jgi:hypothetical protein
MTTFFAASILSCARRARPVVAVVPLDDFKKLLSHEAVVVASEVYTLFDAGAVGFDEPFARYLVAEFGEILPIKRTIELVLQFFLDTNDGDEWITRSCVSYDAPDFLFCRR